MAISLPSVNKYASMSAEELYNLSTGILSGNMPDYYKQAGEVGGEELEGLLKDTRKSTQKGVEEALALRGGGRSAGMAGRITGESIAGVESGMRYEDYVRAMGNRMGMLNTGVSSMSAAGNLGLGITSAEQTNASLGLESEKFDWKKETYEQEREDAAKARKSQMWSGLLSSAVGAVGSVYGMNILGSALKAKKEV